MRRGVLVVVMVGLGWVGNGSGVGHEGGDLGVGAVVRLGGEEREWRAESEGDVAVVAVGATGCYIFLSFLLHYFILSRATGGHIENINIRVRHGR